MKSVTYIIDIDNDGYLQVDKVNDGVRECVFNWVDDIHKEEKSEDYCTTKVLWKTVKEKLKTSNDIFGKGNRIAVHGTCEHIIEVLEDLQDSIDKFGHCDLWDFSFYFDTCDDKEYGKTHGWHDIDTAIICQEVGSIDELTLIMPEIEKLEENTDKE